MNRFEAWIEHPTVNAILSSVGLAVMFALLGWRYFV